MNNQRIICRPLLRLVNSPYSLTSRSICAESVHRFRWKSHWYIGALKLLGCAKQMLRVFAVFIEFNGQIIQYVVLTRAPNSVDAADVPGIYGEDGCFHVGL